MFFNIIINKLMRVNMYLYKGSTINLDIIDSLNYVRPCRMPFRIAPST